MRSEVGSCSRKLSVDKGRAPADRGFRPEETRWPTATGEDKGEWAETADEGIVPAELGGADAPPEMLDEDPELESEVLGRTTGSDEPATEDGVDLDAGDDADATAQGGPDLEPGAEPDLKDAGLASTDDDLICTPDHA